MTSAVRYLASPITAVAELLGAIVRYREYLRQSVARDLRKKYKRSHLGYAWSMLNPLLMMVILTVVFSHLFNFKVEHYSVFLLSGILPWQYFSSTVLGGLTSVRANKKILEHFPVPAYIFSLSTAFSNLANFALALVPLVVVMIAVGKPVPATILLTPVAIAPLVMVTVGTALFFGALNVFFDDIQHLVGILLQALYYLSPILYGPEHLPSAVARYFYFNPLCPVLGLVRDALFVGVIPPASEIAIAFGVGLAVLCLGIAVFQRASKRFIYFL